MNWASATEFFAMGGYGLYVWGSYAVAAGLMLLEPLLAEYGTLHCYAPEPLDQRLAELAELRGWQGFMALTLPN